MAVLEDILERILEITAAQKNLIKDENTDALERNLQRRQACLDELETIQDLEDLFAASVNARRLHGEIARCEADNQKLMATALSDFRDKMRKNTEARIISTRYQPIYSDINGSVYNIQQ